MPQTVSQRNWYTRHRERILERLRLQYSEREDVRERAKQRASSPEARTQEQVRRQRPESRLKQRARSAAYRALRAGLLVRQPCEACGGPDAQMHHDDYSQPLVVRWLCRRDHFQHHVAHNEIR